MEYGNLSDSESAIEDTTMSINEDVLPIVIKKRRFREISGNWFEPNQSIFDGDNVDNGDECDFEDVECDIDDDGDDEYDDDDECDDDDDDGDDDDDDDNDECNDDGDNDDAEEEEEEDGLNGKEREIETPSRKKRKNVLHEPEVLRSIPCCVMLCLAGLTLISLVSFRDMIYKKSCTEKSQWLLEYLRSHSSMNQGKVVFNFVIGGTSVCLTAWLLATGIAKSTFYDMKKRMIDGVVSIGNRGMKKGHLSGKGVAVVSWLEEFANKFADKIPNSAKWHLPPCMTKIYLFDLFKEECGNHDLETISKTQFYKLWRNKLKHICIPKRSRFTKCDKCTLIKNQLLETQDKTERQRLHMKREIHLQQQNAERQKYYKHAKKGRNHPDKYLSVIIDSMDQAKTLLPHFLNLGKSTGNMWKLKVNVVGVIAHGIGIYGFFDYFQYSHGSNLTINILSSMFAMLQNLPPVLYLQMDNCYGQNKNRYVLGFLCLLIERNIFRKIKISFLMVGHTHEDIDQVFSRFSMKLNKTNAYTLDDLMAVFEKCYSPNLTAILTSDVANIAGILEINKLSNHSQPHVFKLTKENNKAKLSYKRWSTDNEWLPTNDYLLLNSTIDSLQKAPSKLDDLDFERVKADIKKNQMFLPTKKVEWWDSFFERVENSGENDNLERDVLKEVLEKSCRSVSKEIQESVSIPNEEVAIKPVLIGKKRGNITTSRIEIGIFVLTDLAKYPDEWPQVGRVIQICENIQIVWYKGSKTGPWSVCTVRIPGERGKRQEWVENIKAEEILLTFKLTPGKCLPKSVKDRLDDYRL